LPRYGGGQYERDAAYHQGAAWPWLAGPFIEAWVRAHGASMEIKEQARRRFLRPLMQRLNEAGIGHVSELADGQAPHRSRGCPFQAWSIAELIRVERRILGHAPASPT
ncbi:MAG TPA: amylo-alpha-1,6-glucosidase, partial [Polyangiaceae bacterium]